MFAIPFLSRLFSHLASVYGALPIYRSERVGRLKNPPQRDETDVLPAVGGL